MLCEILDRLTRALIACWYSQLIMKLAIALGMSHLYNQRSDFQAQVLMFDLLNIRLSEHQF